MTTIRELGRADLPKAASLIGQLDLFPPELLAEMTASFLSGNPQAEIWGVAEVEERLLGLAYCAPEKLTDGTWNLYLIAVASAAQGTGVGTAMLQWLESRLAERKARLLLVETSSLPAFETARRFYRRSGLEEEARIRDFYQPGDDKIVFRKLLQEMR